MKRDEGLHFFITTTNDYFRESQSISTIAAVNTNSNDRIDKLCSLMHDIQIDRSEIGAIGYTGSPRSTVKSNMLKKYNQLDSYSPLFSVHVIDAMVGRDILSKHGVMVGVDNKKDLSNLNICSVKDKKI
ncbi:hypothetical protein RF11_16472 [Thelohanellus kitauei]|uniref:Uncharacterized protein n=1 Tax=Thelohanellus kitauei TaxID=669202 RepID=A0A0C2N231_THEKT|nr:hypothetical protein RF11_16472 [Thelohanellus kitauei]